VVNDAPTTPRCVFFGTPHFAEIVLDELVAAGYTPVLIVTAPDKPKGRKLLTTPSEVKTWATAHNVPVCTPEKLRDETFLQELQKANCDLFLVAAYGKIIPKAVLDLPKYGTLNVHPSLLPKFRGASPIESAILWGDDHTGVSIMVVDEEMDHGPIVAQKDYRTNDWPPKVGALTEALAHEGGKLLAASIPEWIRTRSSTPQDHARATFTKKIAKEDGLIDLTLDPLMNYKKIRALDAYCFILRGEKPIRVRITDATYEELPKEAGGTLTLTRVIPEGKKEMSYEDFLRGLHH
jgi:methionyl-tRNA formyltransferase